MSGRKCVASCRLALTSLALIALASCGGPAGQSLVGLQSGPNPDPAVELPGLDSLPALPTGADDPVLPRGVSLADNNQNGNQAVKSSHNAVFTNGTGLDMGPAGVKKNGWAMWRWGAFQNSNQPRQLKTDITFHGSTQYWVLLSNYSKNRWQVFGPNKTANATFDCSVGNGYLSPTGKNCYVVIFVTDTNKMTVNSLDLVCDSDATPPGAPSGLNATNITSHSVTLKWTGPSDQDVVGYRLESTPPVADPGLIPNTPLPLSFPVPGLDPQTSYQMTLRAEDAAGNRSGPSNTASFKTKANGPPVPDFTYNPTDVQKNVAVTFDPSTTTDPDDPPANLHCHWDWDNDGAYDQDSEGLGTVQHSFPNKGPVTVTLAVSDGSTPWPTVSKSFNVGQQLETRDTGYALGGDGAVVIGGDVDYTSGRIAVVMQGAGTMRLRYFDGTTWNAPVDMSSLAANTFSDVALAPAGKIDVLMSYQDTSSNLYQHWVIFETDGSSPLAQTKTQQVPDIGGAKQQYFGGAKLAIGPNGRATVAIATCQNPAALGDPLPFYLSIMHEKSDGSFQTAVQWNQQNGVSPFTVERKDDTSYCVFSKLTGSGSNWSDPGSLGVCTVTDSGSSSSNVQTYAGNDQQIISDKDPSDGSHVFWALRSDNNKIYFGDNYGTANGSQSYTPSRAPLTLLGVGLAGDNQSNFYWADIDANDETWIRGYKTASSTLSEPLHGVALCQFGFGGWYQSGGTDGVYSATSEVRDGEVTGYLFNGATVARTDQIATPVDGANIGANSQAFIANDGSFVVLNKQQNPTALMHVAPSVGAQFANPELLGIDTYANPDCAASGTTPGDMLLGAFYNTGGVTNDLTLFHFAPGDQTGTYTATYTAVGLAKLVYNPTANQTMVAYTQNGSKTLLARTWNGTTWSSAATVYTSTGKIIDMVLKVRPDGQWGIAWDDENSNVRMAETSSGAWQAPNTLSTTGLNFGVGSLGMEYASNGDAGLAVERLSGTTGLYFGLKPLGSGTATWEVAQATQGFEVSSINVHFLFGTTPTILYNKGGVTLAQKNGGTWTASGLAFYISGSPLVSVMDSAGTLAIAGKDNLTGQSAVCFLSQ